MSFSIKLTDDMNFSETKSYESNESIEEICQEWVNDGDYGDEGNSVDVTWVLLEDGDKIDTGWVTVDVEPNHKKLIREATKRYSSRSCGDDPDNHDWTREGEGGLKENPGVFSTGGTRMSFLQHCKKCGLHCVEHKTGRQRNPGEHDTVTYSMPDSWDETEV